MWLVDANLFFRDCPLFTPVIFAWHTFRPKERKRAKLNFSWFLKKMNFYFRLLRRRYVCRANQTTNLLDYKRYIPKVTKPWFYPFLTIYPLFLSTLKTRENRHGTLWDQSTNDSRLDICILALKYGFSSPSFGPDFVERWPDNSRGVPSLLGILPKGEFTSPWRHYYHLFQELGSPREVENWLSQQNDLCKRHPQKDLWLAVQVN